MSTPLHPCLAELCAELAQSRARLLDEVARVPVELAPIRPAPGDWSVAEIVEHLQIVEDGIGRLLGKLAKQADTLGPETRSASVLHNLDDFDVRSRRRQIQAPAPVCPSGAATLDESLGRLATSRTRLVELLAALSGRALGQLSASHRLLGELDFYQWLLFLSQHEERHTVQIRETGARVSRTTATTS